MSLKQSTFNNEWLDKALNPDFQWLKAVSSNRYQAHCTLCLKNFELSNMGRRAVTSHQKSAGHKKRVGLDVSLPNIGSFMTKSKSEATSATGLLQQCNESINPGATSGDAPLATVDVQVPTTSSASPAISGSVVKGPTGCQIAKLNNFVVNDAVTDSEILWALKVVWNHH
jgi:hypothetical protein